MCQYVGCGLFPSVGVRRDRYIVPAIKLDPEAITTVMVSEAPEKASEYYYAKGSPSFQQTTIQALQEAGANVSSISDSQVSL